MCVQAIKAVDEIGETASRVPAGPACARPPTPSAHEDFAARRAFTRPTNHAGGLEGGITNGEPVVCRAWMKPIATLRRPLASVDIVTKEPDDAAFERSDVCAVAAASVVGEADGGSCITLVDALLEVQAGRPRCGSLEGA